MVTIDEYVVCVSLRKKERILVRLILMEKQAAKRWDIFWLQKGKSHNECYSFLKSNMTLMRETTSAINITALSKSCIYVT
jgi:hypothetical protein